MKPIIYFAGAIRSGSSQHEVIVALIQYLKDTGHAVLTEHVASSTHTDAAMTAEHIETRDIGWLDTATHIIAEFTAPSTGTGREIEYARLKGSFGKIPAKILCLYAKDKEYYASPMIRGMDPERYPNIEVRSYESINEAQKIIEVFLG